MGFAVQGGTQCGQSLLNRDGSVYDLLKPCLRRPARGLAPRTGIPYTAADAGRTIAPEGSAFGQVFYQYLLPRFRMISSAIRSLSDIRSSFPTNECAPIARAVFRVRAS